MVGEGIVGVKYKERKYMSEVDLSGISQRQSEANAVRSALGRQQANAEQLSGGTGDGWRAIAAVGAIMAASGFCTFGVWVTTHPEVVSNWFNP